MGLDQGEMSAPGQKRRSGRPLVASGLPRLADDFGARPWARTVLLTGLRSAGVTVHHEAAGRAKSRRGPKRKNVGQKPRANVSDGSTTDLRTSWSEVRSSPNNGHVTAASACPKGANRRHMHRSKQHLYSITSSARLSNVAGISMPSALAVLSGVSNRLLNYR